MVVHEVAAIFDLDEKETDDAPVLRAAGLYHSAVPVIRAGYQIRLAISRDAHSVPSLIGILRCDEVFGPGDQDSDRFVARIVRALLVGETVRSETVAVRDYVFIRDAARACVELAEAVGRAGHSIERPVRSGWELTDAQMVRVLADAVAGMPPASHTAAFADAIVETVEWYRQAVASPRARRAA